MAQKSLSKTVKIFIDGRFNIDDELRDDINMDDIERATIKTDRNKRMVADITRLEGWMQANKGAEEFANKLNELMRKVAAYWNDEELHHGRTKSAITATILRYLSILQKNADEWLQRLMETDRQQMVEGLTRNVKVPWDFLQGKQISTKQEVKEILIGMHSEIIKFCKQAEIHRAQHQSYSDGGSRKSTGRSGRNRNVRNLNGGSNSPPGKGTEGNSEKKKGKFQARKPFKYRTGEKDCENGGVAAMANPDNLSNSNPIHGVIMTVIHKNNEGRERSLALAIDTGNTAGALALKLPIFKQMQREGLITRTGPRTVRTVSTDTVSSNQTCPAGILRYRDSCDKSKILSAKVFGCCVPCSKIYDGLLPQQMMAVMGLIIMPRFGESHILREKDPETNKSVKACSIKPESAKLQQQEQQQQPSNPSASVSDARKKKKRKKGKGSQKMSPEQLMRNRCEEAMQKCSTLPALIKLVREIMPDKLDQSEGMTNDEIEERCKHMWETLKGDCERNKLTKMFIQQLFKMQSWRNPPGEEWIGYHQELEKFLDEGDRRAKLTNTVQGACEYNEKMKNRGLEHNPKPKKDIKPIQQPKYIPIPKKLRKVFIEYCKLMKKRKLHSLAGEKLQQLIRRGGKNAPLLMHHIGKIKHGATGQPYDVKDVRFILCAQDLKEIYELEAPFAFATKNQIRDLVSGKKFFGVIDVSKFFPSIPANYRGKFYYRDDKNRPCVYNTVVQGDMNAPSMANKVMNELFGDLIAGGKVLIHVDDILIASMTAEEHMQTVKAVLDRLIKYGLCINTKKSVFMSPIARFLGWIINEKGIEVDVLRYEALFTWLVKENKVTKKQATRMVHFLAHFSLFIKNCDAAQTYPRAIEG